MTSGVPDRSRGLYVYMVNQPTIDAGALRSLSDPGSFRLVQSAPSLVPDEIDFRIDAFGCHAGSVAFAAWAPASMPSTSPATGEVPLRPAPNDYLTFSDVRHPYCGFYTHPERIDLILEEGTAPAP